MSTQFKSITLINLQSWGEQTEEMQFDTECVNIIKGRNETGKSVLFKVLYEMCFPGYHGTESILRRKCSVGVAAFVMTNGVAVFWELREKSRAFHITLPNSSETKTFYGQAAPREVIDALGLIVNHEYKIILNVIDKDVDMPFVRTSEKYNAAVLQSLLEPDDVRNLLANTQVYLERIHKAHDVLYKQILQVDSKQSAYEFVNVPDLRSRGSSLFQTGTICKSTIRIYNSIVGLEQIREQAVEKPDDSFLKYSKDIELIAGLRNTLKQIKLTHSICSKQIMSADKIKNGLDITQHVTPMIAIALKIQQYVAICESQPAVPVAPPEEVESGITKLKQLRTVQRGIISVAKAKSKLQECSTLLETSETELLELQTTLGVCPTCGKAFGESVSYET